jgi:pimeloyl-ACP methyl ester carboxylesterase
VENGRLVAGSIPGSELVVLPDANHVLTTDRTAEVNRLLLDWLTRHGG